MTTNKMTAIDLAEYLDEWDVIKDNPFSKVVGKKSAEMLRRQHEAIKQLRESLEHAISWSDDAQPYTSWIADAEKALADTEGL